MPFVLPRLGAKRPVGRPVRPGPAAGRFGHRAGSIPAFGRFSGTFRRTETYEDANASRFRSRFVPGFGLRFGAVRPAKIRTDSHPLPIYSYLCRMKTKILFVCLGNICRSPAAEGILRHMVARSGLEDRIEADSAGTYAGHAGELPDPRMRRAAARRGYDLTHRARRIRREDFHAFDRIVVMDDANYENVHRLAPSRDCAGKIFRMTDFCRRSARTCVPDPYYEGDEGFELVLDLLEEGCEGLLDELRNRSRD